ncbi:hypothetical protein Elgi_37400 [Paenibacillus elgii]|uniref:hypothetical protein n=1 Tax=Paenibacillus elgii TaxID=189691 RepID=UPI002D7D25AD|nr:hypothetical protein Elgi_37400 [Paenibacillus elgii]
MDIKQLDKALSGKPFFFSAIHDYTLKDDHIQGLGLYEEDMVHLRTMIPEDWVFIETRRNPENDFLRIKIVKRN